MRLPVLCLLLAATHALADDGPSFLDQAGAPIPSARVLASEPGEGEPITCATAPGFRPMRLAPPATGVVVLQRGGTVSGVARDGDGAPIAGVTLRLEKDESLGPCARSAVTDEKGAFTLAGLPDGRISIAVAPPPAYMPTPPRALRLVGPESRRLDLKLGLACRPVVTVNGPDGKPLQGAQVRIFPEFDKFPPKVRIDAAATKVIEDFRGTSAVDGRVVLGAIPWRDSYRVAATAKSLAPQSQRVPCNAAATTATIQLTPGGGIDLRATDEEGSPRGTPEARLVNGPDADLIEKLPPGGADGKLAIRMIPPGTWSLELRAAGGRPRLVRGIVVAEGKVTAVGDVVLPPGAALEGIVTSDSSPIGDASVEVRTFLEGKRLELEAKTGPDGRFRFEGLDPEASADVSVEADGWLPDRVAHVRPGDNVVVTLERALSVSGRVTDAESGEPVAAFKATDQTAARDHHAGEDSVDGKDGEFEMKTLPAGEHVVMISAAGYATKGSEPFTLRPGDEAPRLEIALDHGLRLTGRVVEADGGAPIEGATVIAGERGGPRTATDADGGFVLDGLTSPTDVRVAHRAHVTRTIAALDVTAQARPLVVELKRGGSLDGRVLRGGEPLAGAEISSGSQHATSNADGTYLLEGLAEGEAHVMKVDTPDSFAGLETATVDIKAGQRAHHDFGVGARLVGRISRRGEPAAGAQVTLGPGDFKQGGFSSQDGSPNAYADDDGNYAIHGLSAQAYTATIRWQDRVFGRKITLAPGAEETRLDIEIPDLHVGGIVVDKSTNAPIPGAQITFVIPPQKGEGRMTSISDNDLGEILTVSSSPISTDVSGADGRFVVLLDAPGKYFVDAYAAGYHYERDKDAPPLEITTSKDDLTVTMSSGVSVTVKLTDGRTGQAIAEGNANMMSMGNNTGTGGRPPFVFESVPTGVPLIFAGYTKNLACVTFARTLEPGADVTLDAVLMPGGDLRLHVPAEMLTVVGNRLDSHGNLRMTDGNGAELTRFLDLEVPAEVEQLAPDEWLFHHLPSGPLAIAVGPSESARTANVDIREGVPAEADLR